MAKKTTKRKLTEDHEGETYLFLRGKAKVPGFLFSGKPVWITRREFEELTKMKELQVPDCPLGLMNLIEPYLRSGGWKKTSQIYTYVRVNNIRQSKKFLLSTLNSKAICGGWEDGEKLWIL